MLQKLNLILHAFVFDKVMNICNWTVALLDTNFGWEPRALAPDLKSWTLSVTVLKFQVDRQNHKTTSRKTLDAVG